MSFYRFALLSAAILLPACSAEGQLGSFPLDEDVDAQERCLGCDWGPPVTNTHGLNGLSVSALDTTGQMYDGWRLESVELVIDGAHQPLYDVYADEGVLHGRDIDDVWYSGEDFVDSRWTVRLEATDELATMDAVDFTEDGSATRYTFFGIGGANNDRGFTCAQDPDSEEYSVVLFDDLDVNPADGTHFERPNTIYFGCISGAVGKAARWGYSPWVSDADGHQAATRAVRADYCGNGTAYTVQGTQVQITDVFDIHDLADEQRPTEAMWGPEGAQCLTAPRLGHDPSTIVCGGTTLPECGEEDGLKQWPQALLWTKVWI
jgi:hypothetical protein